jgi:hypothetical protein
LALAAACAAKAAAITLKHTPANAQLLQARHQLLAHIDAAIEGSDKDSDASCSSCDIEAGWLRKVLFPPMKSC